MHERVHIDDNFFVASWPFYFHIIFIVYKIFSPFISTTHTIAIATYAAHVCACVCLCEWKINAFSLYDFRVGINLLIPLGKIYNIINAHNI